MNTLQLREKLNVIKGKWRVQHGDVVPRDMLDIYLFPSAYIVNSEDSGFEGKHWIAFAALSLRRIYFFDSLGKRPEYYGFTIPYTISVNDQQLQSDYANTCGEFCLYYLYYTFQGMSSDNILKVFTCNTTRNDAIVKRFVKRLK